MLRAVHRRFDDSVGLLLNTWTCLNLRGVRIRGVAGIAAQVLCYRASISSECTVKWRTLYRLFCWVIVTRYLPSAAKSAVRLPFCENCTSLLCQFSPASRSVITCQENTTEQAPSNGLSDSKTDFYSQLAAINSVTAAPPQPASNQPAGQAVTGVPAASPPANKGMHWKPAPA